MDLAYKEKLLKKLLLRLRNSVVLVEGKRDREALEGIGVDGTILTAVGRNEKIIERAVSEAEGRKITLLFDYDSEGERKNKFFKELFFHSGHSADSELRKKLRMLFRITTIEELPRAYYELMDQVGNMKRRKLKSTGSS